MRLYQAGQTGAQIQSYKLFIYHKLTIQYFKFQLRWRNLNYGKQAHSEGCGYTYFIKLMNHLYLNLF